jgi:hypothetical protein
VTAFKIGDRVRITHGVHTGEEVTVCSTAVDGLRGMLVQRDDDPTLIFMRQSLIELIEPRPTWTDEQVTTLVAIAQSVAQDIEAGRCGYATNGIIYRHLREALAPFEDDPDAELVEMMAHRIHHITRGCDYPWSGLREESQQMHRRQAREFIAAVRAHDRKDGEA